MNVGMHPPRTVDLEDVFDLEGGAGPEEMARRTEKAEGVMRALDAGLPIKADTDLEAYDESVPEDEGTKAIVEAARKVVAEHQTRMKKIGKVFSPSNPFEVAVFALVAAVEKGGTK